MSKRLHITDQFKSFSKIPNGKFWENSVVTERGASASHATAMNLDCDTNIYPTYQATSTPDTLLKVTSSLWCGSDTAIFGKHGSADFLLHSTSHTKTGGGNVHEWLSHYLQGKFILNAIRPDRQTMYEATTTRDNTEIRDEIQRIKRFASHLSAFSYGILKFFLLCKLLTAGTLLLNHFPKALLPFRGSLVGIFPSLAQMPLELVPERAHAITATPSHPLL